MSPKIIFIMEKALALFLWVLVELIERLTILTIYQIALLVNFTQTIVWQLPPNPTLHLRLALFEISTKPQVFCSQIFCMMKTWKHQHSYSMRRRQWHPTPVLLPGESHGWRCLVVCCLWGRIESDTTEATWQQQQQHIPWFLPCRTFSRD